jgi:asparagine synthase (glutamine-hydrolysing)
VGAVYGVVGTDGRPWSEADLAGVAAALRPLGGDGGGAWAGTAGRCGVAVGAASRRGASEDAFVRPAIGAGGQLVLAADLRLDNRDELTASLGLSRHSSLPDNALVLAGYERWGEGVLNRLLGEFALALVDRARGGVLLARDHVGARPLVVHQRPRALAFASVALALTGLEGIGRTPDLVRAAEALALAYSTERTYIEGVRWLPPGTALWIDESGVRRSPWWLPSPIEPVDAPAPIHEQRLRDALEAAVASRLSTRGAAGASVSGGLDSTSVAATAARRLAPDRLPTYTAAPPPGWLGGERAGWDADESALVLRLAELHPTMTPSFVHVEAGTSLFELHEPLWELGAGPVRNPCNWLWYHRIASHAANDGVTALLTGTRGNLFFSADGPHWLIELVRRGRARTAAREAAAWTRFSGRRWYEVVRQEIAAPLAPAPARTLIRVARGQPSPIDDWLRHTALRPDAAAALDLPALLPVLDGRGRHDWRRLALAGIAVIAGQADAYAALAALTGVEDRDPTADRRVVEAALAQPEWVRRHGGESRAVARRAMADRLPAEIVQRTKRGEQLPDWLDVMTGARSELRTELDEVAQHGPSRELVDVERLRRLLRSWPDRTARGQPEVVRDYRLALFRALLVSRHLRWLERRLSVAPEAAAAALVR